MQIDLFQEIDIEVSKKLVAQHIRKWVDYLYVEEIEKLSNIIKLLESTESKIYPSINDVFRIYQNIDPIDVSCLILGKEPYMSDNATGFAFACEHTIQPSLDKIMGAITRDVGPRNFSWTDNKSLSHLVRQRVMLLNCKLVVSEDSIISDINWDFLIDATIRIVQKNNPTCPFLLWGNEAKSKSKLIKTNLKLEYEHPVAASYASRDWECKHFSIVNNYLKDNHMKPIKWIL